MFVVLLLSKYEKKNCGNCGNAIAENGRKKKQFVAMALPKQGYKFLTIVTMVLPKMGKKNEVTKYVKE